MDSTEANQTSSKQALSVGWIGLGSMGLAMAVNMQKHLTATGAPNLHYWNRTISKLGGVACENVADVPRNCGITFISVSPTAFPQLNFTSH
jgi:3-hydroxyisobutyrate dehydrogenase-like beta-hydroxyacid dehydrogenase